MLAAAAVLPFGAPASAQAASAALSPLFDDEDIIVVTADTKKPTAQKSAAQGGGRETIGDEDRQGSQNRPVKGDGRVGRQSRPLPDEEELARKKAEEAAQAEAKRKAEEEAAQAEARKKAAEEAAQAEARRKAAEEAAQAEAKRKAEEEAARAEAQRKAAEEAARAQQDVHQKVRLTWPIIPGAVRYEVVLQKTDALQPDEPVDSSIASQPGTVEVQSWVFTNGTEFDLSAYGAEAAHYYFRVAPLDHDGNRLQTFSAPRPVSEGAFDTTSPLPTTEFDRMAYVPLYPVFSWVPVLGCKHHTVEVYRLSDSGEMQELVQTVDGGENDAYEDGGYTFPGNYGWRVRAVDEYGTPASDWSPLSTFRVTTPTPFAALGDSITHGGGAVTVPPSYILYDWETYAGVPVKNLGESGDTTAQLLARFDTDVLPFHPSVLVIMGGVNDYRLSVSGMESVGNLTAIREKCYEAGITPVFVTPTPINPDVIAHYGQIEVPPYEWQQNREFINAWVRQQDYHIDISDLLTDAYGNLDARYTSDGLHPDYEGKKRIGQQIGAYLRANFPAVVQMAVQSLRH